jgi:hypothetical protein
MRSNHTQLLRLSQSAGHELVGVKSFTKAHLFKYTGCYAISHRYYKYSECSDYRRFAHPHITLVKADSLLHVHTRLRRIHVADLAHPPLRQSTETQAQRNIQSWHHVPQGRPRSKRYTRGGRESHRARGIAHDDGSDGGRPAAIRGIAYEVEYVPPDL